MTKPIYRMSNTGTCPRALSAERLGLEGRPKPDWLEAAAQEGKKHEEWIIEELRADDIAVYNQQEKLTIELPSCILVGHIEGLINDHGIERLFEIKSMSQFEFQRWQKGRFREFPHYAAQLACYFEATLQSTCLYIVKNRSSGYKKELTLDRKDFPFSEIASKLKSVEQHLKLYNYWLYPANYNDDSIECRRCSYAQKYCKPKPIELTPVEEIELGTAAINWREGTRMIKLAEKMVNDARKTFKTYMAQQNFKRFYHNKLAMVISPIERESYDKGVLQTIFSKQQLEPAQKYTSYEVLKITDTEKKET